LSLYTNFDSKEIKIEIKIFNKELIKNSSIFKTGSSKSFYFSK